MLPADAGYDEREDDGLMLAYAAGDAAAFERLYARHRGPSYRYLLRHLGDTAHAAELHQDVWLKVIAGRDGYASRARFTTWLYTLARNRLIDHWRSQRGARFTSLDEDDSGVDLDEHQAEHRFAGNDASRRDPLAHAIDAEALRRLTAALDSISGPQRDAFLLHVEAGLSLTTIAGLAGVPVETIKSRLRYAYRRLRKALEDLQ